MEKFIIKRYKKVTMKKLFIETKYSGKIELPKDLISELPKKVMLASTVQYVDHLNEIKRKLTAYGKEVSFFKSAHGRHNGQILGCDNFVSGSDADAFLYVGDGEFHPLALLVNEKPVFVYGPSLEKWRKLGRKEWDEMKLKKKVSLMKFYSARKVGIVVSVKEKQKSIQGKDNSIKELKERLEKEGKEVYLFLGNEIRQEAVGDFNFIDCWVNTACPRITGDFKNMVNLRDLK